ncbi:MAG TPA: hypothetical protein VGR79_13375 [Stellaceae bacterium]|nr:hypothetical protein [Stellaceae bacterium]
MDKAFETPTTQQGVFTMTKLGLLAAALIALSPLAMAQSNTSSLSGGGIVLAQAEPMQGQTANSPNPSYEQPNTMPTYQKNDGTDRE